MFKVFKNQMFCHRPFTLQSRKCIHTDESIDIFGRPINGFTFSLDKRKILLPYVWCLNTKKYFRFYIVPKKCIQFTHKINNGVWPKLWMPPPPPPPHNINWLLPWWWSGLGDRVRERPPGFVAHMQLSILLDNLTLWQTEQETKMPNGIYEISQVKLLKGNLSNSLSDSLLDSRCS